MADFGSARFATQEGYPFAEQHPPERAGEVIGSLESLTVRPHKLPSCILTHIQSAVLSAFKYNSIYELHACTQNMVKLRGAPAKTVHHIDAAMHVSHLHHHRKKRTLSGTRLDTLLLPMVPFFSHTVTVLSMKRSAAQHIITTHPCYSSSFARLLYWLTVLRLFSRNLTRLGASRSGKATSWKLHQY